jgi:uncharacterized membrane protein
MHDTTKLFLRIVSAVLIIFGVIASVAIVIGLTARRDAGAGWLVATVVLLISTVAETAVGFIGLRKSRDQSQANFFVATGFVLGILMLLSMILGFSVWSLIGLTLPVAYIVGGYMLRVREE